MDTRTPRTPTGGRSSGFDDTPALSMVKVPCDPAQVIVNHASFRVQLSPAGRSPSPRVARHVSAAEETVRMPAVGAAGGGARRRAPVVWSGKSEPGDPGAGGLLQAVRGSGVRRAADVTAGGDPQAARVGYDDGGATQVIPRVDVDDPYGDTVQTPAVGGARGGDHGPTRLLPQMRMPGSADDEARADDPYDDGYGDEAADFADDAAGRRAGKPPNGVRHAYYPGRRLNLGVVLLPLRVFLGFISIYAGMGKLCDPVYFDGGERGSMVKWLNSLHPWALAEPLRDWALQHPVGAGLVIAFLQVIVGVLTVLGLWQRVAAGVGMLLSIALLVTVSWKTVPAYDAPDIIYLAAWSPLIIAGAPVYSVDARLAGEAWRTLGPRAALWELRRRVLRRGGLVGTVVVGLTLLVGSLLGGAVRDADRVTVPGPGEAPRNELPGSPLPGDPDGKRERRSDTRSPSASAGTPTQGTTASPSQEGATGTPDAARETGSVSGTGSRPSATQGTGEQAPAQQQPAPTQERPPAATSGPTSSGGTSGGAGPGGGTTGGSDTTSGGSGSGGSGGGRPGLLGGVLG
ncbi:DoxX family protein [Streptomyces sp. AN091965]|uniref:DoxX family protein n=1 Tax=Streptomyces sp. AN091965 TaxID=2927803 RepID=UPI001F617510|nr:DoxX family protein [Streptomyces sp. AN091965]MCI3931500.1 DoxX family membrane protein [Streptomyces sp. AN091965]